MGWIERELTEEALFDEVCKDLLDTSIMSPLLCVCSSSSTVLPLLLVGLLEYKSFVPHLLYTIPSRVTRVRSQRGG